MSPRVVHQPRVAWDFVQVLIAVADSGDDLFFWFSSRIGEVLGHAYRIHLYDTRMRLGTATRVDVRQAEMGMWRARLEDVLRAEPDLADDLRILRMDAAARLGGPARRLA